ncbi:MAG TPA: hypothetical protein VFZ61_05130 [Polyangiales bacterium]
MDTKSTGVALQIEAEPTKLTHVDASNPRAISGFRHILGLAALRASSERALR